MARVALIKSSLGPVFNLLLTPPLGILSLASVLRNRGHQVMVLDQRLRPGDFSDTETRLKAFQPDIVGISAMTQEDAALHRIAGISRKIPGVRFVVAGGPHPSNYSEVVMPDENIDFIVRGEGEETLPELIGVLESGRPAVSVAGITGRDSGGEIWRSEPRPYSDGLDSFPFPAWDLLDFPSYGKRKRFANLALREYAAIITSRGCPYQCAYCHNIFGKRFRSRKIRRAHV